MNLYEQYLEAKKELDQAKRNMEEVQVAIYEKHFDAIGQIDYGSTLSTEDMGFKVKIVKKETVAVDQDLAKVIGLGFKAKYSLDKTAYKKLSVEDKKRVDECLTTKPAKPTFTVEAIDGN